MKQKMSDKKYSIENYTSKVDIKWSGLSCAVGLVSTVYALVTQDQETAIAGGFLFIGGIGWFTGEYIKAYCKAKVDYMNETPRME